MPVGDNRDVMDMDVIVDICQVVPDVINSCALVAIVRAMRVKIAQLWIKA